MVRYVSSLFDGCCLFCVGVVWCRCLSIVVCCLVFIVTCLVLRDWSLLLFVVGRRWLYLALDVRLLSCVVFQCIVRCVRCVGRCIAFAIVRCVDCCVCLWNDRCRL